MSKERKVSQDNFPHPSPSFLECFSFWSYSRVPKSLLSDKAKTLCRTCPSYAKPQAFVTYGTGSSEDGEQEAACFFTAAWRSVELSVQNGRRKF